MMALDLKKLSESYRPPEGVKKEYQELEDAFYKLFNARVPREMMPASVTDEQVAAALRTCIEKKENVLMQLLGVKASDDVRY